MKIIDYEDSYQDDFKKLSYEWLEKYLYVEPEDEKILSNPRSSILDGGGFIFLAQDNEKIVGTISLIRLDPKTFELAKLAVTEKCKSLGLGSRLMEKALQEAKIYGAEKIILYTSHKLIPALALYKKFGFKNVELVNNKYLESDIKMELLL